MNDQQPQYVRLEKIEQLRESPAVNVSDWFEGVLEREVEVGRPVRVWLTADSRDSRWTYMHTSEVKRVVHADDCMLITTCNSVYRLRFIDGSERPSHVQN